VEAGPLLTDALTTGFLARTAPERAPHVPDAIDLSMYLGQKICQPDAVKVAARDAAFFASTALRCPAFPHLTAGVIGRNGDGTPLPAVGLLSPHGRVRTEHGEGPLDALTSGGFVLIADHSGKLDPLSPVARRTMASLHAAAIALADDPGDDRVIADLDGRMITSFLCEKGLAAMMVRPGFYVYGGLADADQMSEVAASLSFALTPHEVVRRNHLTELGLHVCCH
jgi:hypothetical protein